MASPTQSQRHAIYHEIHQLAGVQLATRIRESLTQLSRPPPARRRHRLWLMNAWRAEQLRAGCNRGMYQEP